VGDKVERWAAKYSIEVGDKVERWAAKYVHCTLYSIEVGDKIERWAAKYGGGRGLKSRDMGS
jgi:hypothetical protein